MEPYKMISISLNKETALIIAISSIFIFIASVLNEYLYFYSYGINVFNLPYTIYDYFYIILGAVPFLIAFIFFILLFEYVMGNVEGWKSQDELINKTSHPDLFKKIYSLPEKIMLLAFIIVFIIALFSSMFLKINPIEHHGFILFSGLILVVFINKLFSKNILCFSNKVKSTINWLIIFSAVVLNNTQLVTSTQAKSIKFDAIIYTSDKKENAQILRQLEKFIIYISEHDLSINSISNDEVKRIKLIWLH
jgi:hypothetical protein